MAKKFATIDEVDGYVTKPDPTNAPENVLVSGSQNVIIDDQKKVKSRAGYSRDGAASAAYTPVRSSYDWETSFNATRNLRYYDDELEVRFVKADDSVNWIRVVSSLSTTAIMSFATWWDTGEDKDLLLFVLGDANIYEWGGGVAEVDSVTTNSITKKGTNTWGQDGFYSSRNRTVLINGTEYAYTGGAGTTTLTGVTPDPSAGGVASGDVATQKIVTNSNSPASGAVNDILAQLNNHLYVGSRVSGEVRVSSNTTYTTFTFSSPRVPGEGATLVLDNNCVSMVPQEDSMYIATGKDNWYKTSFVLSDDNAREILQILKLKTGTGAAPIHHDLVAKAGDFVAFVNNNKEAVILGRIEELEQPNLKNLSDPIKTDFDAETFTSGHVKAHKNRIYFATPTNDKLYIVESRLARDKQGREFTVRFWQPPQILPVRKLAIIDGDIYGHSSGVPETYKLFDGTDDNGNPFKAKAAFSYRNFGDPVNNKRFDEYFVEGYITANTKLILRLKYDYQGFTATQEFEIDGADESIIFEAIQSGALGDNPLGDAPLGDQPDAVSDLPKFKVIETMALQDFQDLQVEFETDSQDYQWEVLRHGPNVLKSTAQPVGIKK